jgi:hypothetical protein
MMNKLLERVFKITPFRKRFIYAPLKMIERGNASYKTQTNNLKVNNRNLTLLLADSLSAIQQHLHRLGSTSTCPDRSPEYTALAEKREPINISAALANGPTDAACTRQTACAPRAKPPGHDSRCGCCRFLPCRVSCTRTGTYVHRQPVRRTQTHRATDRPRKGAGSAGARGAVSRHGARARAELPAAEEHEHPSMHAIESSTDRPART